MGVHFFVGSLSPRLRAFGARAESRLNVSVGPKKKRMSNAEIALVKELIEAVHNGSVLSREIVSRCYYATVSDPPNEKPTTSELWVSAIWERCKEIPAKQFIAARGNRSKLAELCHVLFA